ncbi:hypothetical protein D9M72_647560 [compost metagenome]
MVIAYRAARGEGIAEPESVLEGQGIGDVRERGCPLVGGNNQVVVIAVVPDHPLGRYNQLGGAVGAVQGCE